MSSPSFYRAPNFSRKASRSPSEHNQASDLKHEGQQSPSSASKRKANDGPERTPESQKRRQQLAPPPTRSWVPDEIELGEIFEYSNDVEGGIRDIPARVRYVNEIKRDLTARCNNLEEGQGAASTQTRELEDSVKDLRGQLNDKTSSVEKELTALIFQVEECADDGIENFRKEVNERMKKVYKRLDDEYQERLKGEQELREKRNTIIMDTQALVQSTTDLQNDDKAEAETRANEDRQLRDHIEVTKDGIYKPFDKGITTLNDVIKKEWEGERAERVKNEGDLRESLADLQTQMADSKEERGKLPEQVAKLEEENKTLRTDVERLETAKKENATRIGHLEGAVAKLERLVNEQIDLFLDERYSEMEMKDKEVESKKNEALSTKKKFLALGRLKHSGSSETPP